MSQISPIPSNLVAPAAPESATGSLANTVTAPAAAPSSVTTPPKTSPAPAANPTPDQRLLIQETGELGVLVYTVVDRASGTVINQIPYKQVEELGAQDKYASGQVISTTA
ncbi:MAG TPA: hypothetical protein VMU59_11595 [Caulobacteraceae bacterium]|nr:hypothetical protein [Caulobacteraceae bacterium]